MASNSDIRLGIVGMRLGMWHAGAIAEIDGVSIVAVADNVQGIMPGPNMTLQQFAEGHGCGFLRGWRRHDQACRH